MSAVVALFALCSGVRAQDPAPSSASDLRLQRLMTRFHRADRNGDGQLTREEAQKGMPLVYRHFSEIDTDNKGYVTLAQITSFLEAHPQWQR
jgi:Ca2+-binding EF-hand superfamily protein